MEEYFEANRLNWNDRAVIHAASAMYDLDGDHYMLPPDQRELTPMMFGLLAHKPS